MTAETSGKRGLRKVFMLLANPATFDQRPLMEAHSLARSGRKVTILAWDRELETERDAVFGDGLVVKRMRLRAGHGTPHLTPPKLLLFYLWCLAHLVFSGADAVHCHDVDTLPAGLASKVARVGRSKLVYDMHDLPEAFLRLLPFGRLTQRIFLSLSRGGADHLVVASDGYVPYLESRGFRRERMTVVLNAPPLRDGREYRRKPGGLKVLYYGALEEERGVRLLVDSISGLEGTELVLAGRGSLAGWAAEAAKRAPNIRFLGWLTMAKLRPVIEGADLIPSLYAPKSANILLSTPNKLLRSFSLSIPALVTAGTQQASIVEKYGCGLVIEWGEPATVRKEISSLAKDDARFRAMAEAAYGAFRSDLNWEAMASRLGAAYDRLLQK
ncbi:MAG TPA: glycosyltransferase [Nitrososphaerales archaeon]|nr:glycosyltransferase [Nitrososphaerales archaeon]